MQILNQIIATPGGALVLLACAAFLEVYGDSFFQAGLYQATGTARVRSFLLGAAVLALYALMVNIPRWNFGRLLGIYVVLFFLVAQVLAKVRFGQSPTLATMVGGALIVAGGGVIYFFK